MRAFEFAEPVGGDIREVFGWRGDQAGGTGWTELFGGQPAISRERSFAVASHLEPIFAQEDQDGDALAAIDGQQRADLRPGITVEEPELDAR